MQTIVNRELRKVRKWLEANRLALNIRKTNYVIFHPQAKKCDEFIRTRGHVGHILDAGEVTGALGEWCRLGMKTRVTVGSHLEIKLDAE